MLAFWRAHVRGKHKTTIGHWGGEVVHMNEYLTHRIPRLVYLFKRSCLVLQAELENLQSSVALGIKAERPAAAPAFIKLGWKIWSLEACAKRIRVAMHRGPAAGAPIDAKPMLCLCACKQLPFQGFLCFFSDKTASLDCNQRNRWIQDRRGLVYQRASLIMLLRRGAATPTSSCLGRHVP